VAAASNVAAARRQLMAKIMALGGEKPAIESEKKNYQ
jgi:hypothetical protein